MDMRPDESPQASRARAQARDWLLRLHSGQATTLDADAFRRWRAEPLHARAFAEARRLWAAIEPAAAIAAESTAAAPPLRALPPRPSPAGLAERPGAARVSRRPRAINLGRRAFVGGAIAASAGWLIARSPLGLWPDWEEVAADYRTAVGEQRALDIAGIQVELGARTALNQHHRDGSPSLELVQGEAQFSVPVTAMTPVRVRLDGGVVTLAPGSRVNLRCVAEDRLITCLAGQARVEQGGRTVVLEPAWQARLAEARIASVAPVDPARIDAWRRGVLVFDNEPLARVVDEINRYRPGRILITRAELGRRKVQARIPTAQPDTFLDLVHDVYGARVTTMPGGLTLLG